MRQHRVTAIIASLLLACALGIGVTAALGATQSKSKLVRFTKVPPARTTTTVAEFRFKTRARHTSCRRDDQAYRRCRRSVKYTGLRPGPHTFKLRVRHNGKTRFLKHKWTVVRTGAGGGAAAVAPSTTVSQAPIDPVMGVAVPGSRALVFSDEFNGAAVDPAVWNMYNSPGHAGFGLRRPSALELDGQGNLVITAKMTDGQIVSGGMGARTDFTYGRVEFRVKTEPDPTGTMSGVVLTWPQKQWSPEFTENDIYETGPRVNNRSQFETFIHFGTSNWQKWATHDVDPSQWHTIAMEWHPDLLEIYIDDRLSWSLSDPYAIPDILHHVCLQLDARATRTLTQPVRMWVDYIRVYQ